MKDMKYSTPTENAWIVTPPISRPPLTLKNTEANITTVASPWDEDAMVALRRGELHQNQFPSRAF